MGIYNPPDSSPYYEQSIIGNVYAQTNVKESTVVLGDLNIHFDCPSHPTTAKILNAMSMFSLSQAVTAPTHKHGHTLDGVLFRDEEQLLNSCHVSHNAISDHFPIVCRLDVHRPSRPTDYCKVRNLRGIDQTSFQSDVANSLRSLSSPSAKQLFDSLQSVLDKHAPPTLRKVPHRRSTPWYSAIAERLRSLKRDRRQAERQWRRTRLSVHFDLFKACKHKVTLCR